MIKKIDVWIFIFLLLVIPVIAVPPFEEASNPSVGFDIKYPAFDILKQNTAFEFEFHVYNKSTGKPINAGIGCYFHLYNSSGKHIAELVDNTVSHDYDYGFDIGGGNFSNVGMYSYLVQCNNSELGGFVDAPFEVSPMGNYREKSNILLAILTLLPMLLGIFFLIGASTLNNEDHAPMKIILFLLSIVTFFASLHMAMIGIVRMYNLPEIESAIGNWTYWFGIVFFVIVVYFLIYLFYTMVHKAAEKKKERLNY